MLNTVCLVLCVDWMVSESDSRSPYIYIARGKSIKIHILHPHKYGSNSFDV